MHNALSYIYNQCDTYIYIYIERERETHNAYVCIYVCTYNYLNMCMCVYIYIYILGGERMLISWQIIAYRIGSYRIVSYRIISDRIQRLESCETRLHPLNPAPRAPALHIKCYVNNIYIYIYMRIYIYIYTHNSMYITFLNGRSSAPRARAWPPARRARGPRPAGLEHTKCILICVCIYIYIYIYIYMASVYNDCHPYSNDMGISKPRDI